MIRSIFSSLLAVSGGHQSQKIRPHQLVLLPEIEPKIKGHLVVSTPGSVELAGYFTDLLLQGLFNIDVNIFQVFTKFRSSLLKVAEDIRQTSFNLAGVLW